MLPQVIPGLLLILQANPSEQLCQRAIAWAGENDVPSNAASRTRVVLFEPSSIILVEVQFAWEGVPTTTFVKLPTAAVEIPQCGGFQSASAEVCSKIAKAIRTEKIPLIPPSEIVLHATGIYICSSTRSGQTATRGLLAGMPALSKALKPLVSGDTK